MKLSEIYIKGQEILKNAQIQDYKFDTQCLLEHCFGLQLHEFCQFRNKTITQKEANLFFSLINERKNRKPLQYILGYWYFMGKKYIVKEGVLIPRDDTEVLVSTATELLSSKKNAKVLDLCSGSGIIAITLSKIFADARIFAVEISDVASSVLKENIAFHNAQNVFAKKLDVLDPYAFQGFNDIDLIVSNPPYIPQNDIKNLQKEVLFEPKLALDGGTDGLDFFRAIVQNFKNCLGTMGKICFEIGINQANDVKNILQSNDFFDISVKKDINNIDRVVFGTF